MPRDATVDRFHRRATTVLSGALVVVGVAQVISAAVRGAGAGAYVLGALFVAVGGARLWLESRRRR
ncbi:MAG: hypothetical protein AB1416_06690 [Actinomycetota bacterium]